jgi:phage terminase large subunit-like protein
MSSDLWARAACELAADTGADRIIFESNYGGDLPALAIRTAWDVLRRDDPQRFGAFVPFIESVSARRGKLLRAEPIAQQWIENRIVTSSYLPDLESEWATWQPTDTSSPGRIDASVYLAFALLPIPTSGESTTGAAQMMASANLLTWGAGGR